jgi:hypothetical protein
VILIHHLKGEIIMAEVGRPMDSSERKTRGLKHILHYNFKMAPRIDIGGVKKIASGGLRDYVRQRMSGGNLESCIGVACELAGKVRDGIAERLRRPIEDLEWRADRLENAVFKASGEIDKLIASGVIKSDNPIAELLKASSNMVFGE